MLIIDELTLRPISEKDTSFILSLRNDTDAADEFFSDPPLYDFIHKKWLSQHSSTAIDLIIEDPSNQLLGRVTLTRIDYRHQKAEYGIVIHKDHRGKGIAYRASKRLIEYTFDHLPIRKIWLEVFAENSSAIRLYQKLGFQQEGCFQQEYYKKGLWRDVLRMAVFKDSTIIDHE